MNESREQGRFESCDCKYHILSGHCNIGLTRSSLYNISLQMCYALSCIAARGMRRVHHILPRYAMHITSALAIVWRSHHHPVVFPSMRGYMMPSASQWLDRHST
jgi:hypothetical protein